MCLRHSETAAIPATVEFLGFNSCKKGGVGRWFQAFIVSKDKDKGPEDFLFHICFFPLQEYLCSSHLGCSSDGAPGPGTGKCSGSSSSLKKTCSHELI